MSNKEANGSKRRNIVLQKDATPGRANKRNAQIQALASDINADIINIKDAEIDIYISGVEVDAEMDGDDEMRGSSQARRSVTQTQFGHEELAASSTNPLVGRYGSAQSNKHQNSQAKGSEHANQEILISQPAVHERENKRIVRRRMKVKEEPKQTK